MTRNTSEQGAWTWPIFRMRLILNRCRNFILACCWRRNTPYIVCTVQCTRWYRCVYAFYCPIRIYIYMRAYRFIFIYKNCSKFYWRARLHTIHLNANILWRTPRSSFNCIFILYGVLQFQSSGFCVYIRVQRTTEWTCMSIHNNGWSNLNMFWKSLFSICLISPVICSTVCIINNPATFRCFFFHGCFFAVAK